MLIILYNVGVLLGIHFSGLRILNNLVSEQIFGHMANATIFHEDHPISSISHLSNVSCHNPAECCLNLACFG